MMVATDSMRGRIVGSNHSLSLGGSPNDSRSFVAQMLPNASSGWNPPNEEPNSRQSAQFGPNSPDSFAFPDGHFSGSSDGAFSDGPRPIGSQSSPTVVSSGASRLEDNNHPIGNFDERPPQFAAGQTGWADERFGTFSHDPPAGQFGFQDAPGGGFVSRSPAFGGSQSRFGRLGGNVTDAGPTSGAASGF
jgi:hypothetical protein